MRFFKRWGWIPLALALAAGLAWTQANAHANLSAFSQGVRSHFVGSTPQVELFVRNDGSSRPARMKVQHVETSWVIFDRVLTDTQTIVLTRTELLTGTFAFTLDDKPFGEIGFSRPDRRFSKELELRWLSGQPHFIWRVKGSTAGWLQLFRKSTGEQMWGDGDFRSGEEAEGNDNEPSVDTLLFKFNEQYAGELRYVLSLPPAPPSTPTLTPASPTATTGPPGPVHLPLIVTAPEPTVTPGPTPTLTLPNPTAGPTSTVAPPVGVTPTKTAIPAN